MSCLLWLELFDTALSKISHQRRGFYICENQSWERAFIRAWRRHGHGELIAVPHGPIRFWDLRFFEDPHTLHHQGPFELPQPDLFALNGPVAVKALTDAQYPARSLRTCEALMYGQMANLPTREPCARTEGDPVRVLIITEFDPAVTRSMMQMVVSAAGLLPSGSSLVVKPHLGCPIDAADYPTLNLSVVRQPISDILGDFDSVVTGSRTSAAIEASLMGLPVVVLREDSFLDMSPLRGRNDVRSPRTPDQLAQMLMEPVELHENAMSASDYFFFDPQLPRWVSLLRG